MNRDIELLEKIDAYLLGSLNPEKGTSFEKEIAASSELASHVEIQRKANTLVLGSRLNGLKALMDKDFAEGKVTQSSPKGKWFWGLGVFALLTALTASYVTFTSFPGKEMPGVTVQEIPSTENPLFENPKREIDNSVPFLEKETTGMQKKSPLKFTQTENPQTISVKPDSVISPTFSEPEITKAVRPAIAKERAPLEEKTIKTEKVENPVVTLSENGLPEKSSGQKALSFKPEFGELVKIPLDPSMAVEVQIVNKAGMLQWQEKISGETELSWDGQSVQGGLCPPGLYIYLLDYTNGKRESGQIILY